MACQPTINHPATAVLDCSSYQWWADSHYMLWTWTLLVPWVSLALRLRSAPLTVQWRGWSGKWGPGVFRRDMLVLWQPWGEKWWACQCLVTWRGYCCWLVHADQKLVWSWCWPWAAGIVPCRDEAGIESKFLLMNSWKSLLFTGSITCCMT